MEASLLLAVESVGVETIHLETQMCSHSQVAVVAEGEEIRKPNSVPVLLLSVQQLVLMETRVVRSMPETQVEVAELRLQVLLVEREAVAPEERDEIFLHGSDRPLEQPIRVAVEVAVARPETAE